jgi:cyclophilin family peptidyl-prolyl cis-trans isomerase
LAKVTGITIAFLVVGLVIGAGISIVAIPPRTFTQTTTQTFSTTATVTETVTQASTSSKCLAASSANTTSTTGTGDYAVIQTCQGTIVIELFPQDAPKTVANFESLANSGVYNDLVWHRIVAGFVIQTGDPNTKGALNNTRSTWGTGGTGTDINFENNSLPNDVGYVAMARGSGLNTASSQFYINLVNNTQLNGQYAVFGRVVSGMNVVDAIANLPVYTNSNTYTYDQPINAQDALLISVSIQNGP